MAKNNLKGKVRLMFQDEAGFGRINKPKYCWCMKGIRPTVPSHHIREYRYAYGAIDPIDGESFFLVLPYANTDCMNIFLDELSKTFPNDYIILACDQATWHKSKALVVPSCIQIFHIPPATPEMNPIEQIWKQLRQIGFKNEIFQTLEKVVDRLCETIRSLTKEMVKSITGRKWIIDVFR
jgi:putative transposase